MKKWLGLIIVVAATSLALQGSDSDPNPGDQRASATAPPVMKKSEPGDNVVFTLPGAPAVSRKAAPSNDSELPATEVHLAPPPEDKERPVLHRVAHDYPAEFEQDSADYLNQQIGIWTQADASEMLGEPTRRRPAYADDQSVNGQIVAFADPTGRYKELEMDFDQQTGVLRTLFVYPQSMTWLECRKAFGGNVRSTQANKGRTFYSYLDRRLDVLVDAGGKVISLGMY